MAVSAGLCDGFHQRGTQQILDEKRGELGAVRHAGLGVNLGQLREHRALGRAAHLGDFGHVQTLQRKEGHVLFGHGQAPVGELRAATGLTDVKTVRTEGAPIPLKPLKRWDNGRDVVLAGDAAGVVAPASGEGIYYAMLGGRLAADAAEILVRTGDARALATARQRFMKEHGRVFLVLGMLQYFWYSSDRRRERFVSMCRDPDVQRLTWQSYMNKKLVRRDPMAHVRVFFKDLGHLFGLVAPR